MILDACNKLLEGKRDNENSSMIYIKLRTEGCPKTDALHYASRVRCRSDTTKKMDGPTNYRLLKVKPQRQQETIFLNKGWKQGNLSLDLGKGYEIIEQKKEESQELVRLNKLMLKMNKTKLKKSLGYMTEMNNYFTEQARRRLKGLKPEDLVGEVKEMRRDILNKNLSEDEFLSNPERFAGNSLEEVRRDLEQLGSGSTQGAPENRTHTLTLKEASEELPGGVNAKDYKESIAGGSEYQNRYAGSLNNTDLVRIHKNLKSPKKVISRSERWIPSLDIDKRSPSGYNDNARLRKNLDRRYDSQDQVDGDDGSEGELSILSQEHVMPKHPSNKPKRSKKSKEAFGRLNQNPHINQVISRSGSPQELPLAEKMLVPQPKNAGMRYKAPLRGLGAAGKRRKLLSQFSNLSGVEEPEKARSRPKVVRRQHFKTNTTTQLPGRSVNRIQAKTRKLKQLTSILNNPLVKSNKPSSRNISAKRSAGTQKRSPKKSKKRKKMPNSKNGKKGKKKRIRHIREGSGTRGRQKSTQNAVSNLKTTDGARNVNHELKRKKTRKMSQTSARISADGIIPDDESPTDSEEDQQFGNNQNMNLYQAFSMFIKKAKNKRRYLRWQTKIYQNVALHSKYLSEVSKKAKNFIFSHF